MRKKAERRWTLMVVPHGSGLSRAVEVSQTFVKTLVGIGSVVALTFLVLGVAAISRGVNITRSRALENENRVLANEIQQMRERMAVLHDTLHRFSQREQELRLLAGLTPTDTTVQQAGIGGPAGTWSEGDSLKALGPDGREALAARLDVDVLSRRANILVRSLNQAFDSPSGAAARGDRRLGAHGRRNRRARRGHRDGRQVGRGVRQHDHAGPRLRVGDALRALLEDYRRAWPAREARGEDCLRRLDGTLDRAALALRGVGEPQTGGPAEVRDAGCDRGLTVSRCTDVVTGDATKRRPLCCFGYVTPCWPYGYRRGSNAAGTPAKRPIDPAV